MDQNLLILIIEDDENDVLILKHALTRAGINNPMHVVYDGQQAIDYLRGEGEYGDWIRFPFPKVIFSDLKMPRMGGFDVLHWLRVHPECSVIPIIMLTASKQDQDIKRAYELGANPYLVKPAEIEDLQEMVKTASNFWSWCEIPKVLGNC